MRYAVGGRQRILPSLRLGGAVQTRSDSVSDVSSEQSPNEFMSETDAIAQGLGPRGMGNERFRDCASNLITSMPEEPFPQVAFLGLAERAALVRDGETDLVKWNVLGLKSV